MSAGARPAALAVRRALVALVALVGVSCVSGPGLAVRPKTYPFSCDRPLLVGETRELYMDWTCELGQEGRIGSPARNECFAAIAVTAICVGTPCEASVNDGPPKVDYVGGRRIAVRAIAPGPLDVELDLAHVNGFHERYQAFSCEVLPAPAITLTCTTRDPATGAYAPCPTSLPAGREIQVDVHAEIATGTALPPELHVTFDGEPAPRPDIARAPVTCMPRPGPSPRARDLRCAGWPTAGHHELAARFRDLPPERYVLEVGGARP
jgi:hypothetical protein